MFPYILGYICCVGAYMVLLNIIFTFHDLFTLPELINKQQSLVNLLY